MQVADRLANMIVQENLEERTNMADSTSQFLQAQLEDSRRRLAEYENKLAEFRLRNVGRLPSQTQSNLQLLQMTQTQIQANNDAAVRERDRIAALEKAIAEAGATLDVPLGEIAVSAEGAAPAVTTEGRAGLAQQLRAQRAKVEDLQRRLKEDHPDLAHEKRVLASLESQVTMDAVMNAAAASGGAPATRGVTTADRIAGFQKELDQLQKKQEQRKLDDERLRAQLANYSARVEAAPKLETDLADMMRDYSTIQNQYNSLLAKSEESKIAANLERRQIGEQFRVIEPARLPIRPSFPNRARLNLFGLMGGVAFGLLIVALLEYRDTRFKTDDDVVISLALPVLAVIPAMITTSERKRARRRHIVLGVCTSVGVVGAAVALIAWRWQTVQAWIR
jgi:uncharacterized protein involved in exopolysaccharide biosynthesis